MNYLVAIVLLITIPGTFASIRRGQADANTITPYESALRQLKAAGGVGGMGVVMGMKVSSVVFGGSQSHLKLNSQTLLLYGFVLKQYHFVISL